MACPALSMLGTCRLRGRDLMTKLQTMTAVNAPAMSSVETPVRRVVLIDDHRTFVDLLQFALASTPSMSCVGVAYTPETGIEMVASCRPDVVVVDYEFPGSLYDGIQATAAITSRFPETRVVMLSGHADINLVRRAVSAGACALLPKDGSLPDLLSALETIRTGVLLVGAEVLDHSVTDDRVDPLSAREHDVLAMLAIGLRAQDIADQLGISKNTCRGYIKSLLWKLDAHTQLEAVANARRRGLVTDL